MNSTLTKGEPLSMLHIIVNPKSRTGMGLRIYKKIEPYLNHEQIPYTTYFTNGIGDATKFASKLSSENESVTIIVLGGDGTINEVVCGIQNFELITLGYIPTGSSNDFARDLNLNTDPLIALKNIIHKNKIISMDLGEVTYTNIDQTIIKRKFAVSCGIGFDAAVCQEALHSKVKLFFNKIHMGKLTYGGIAIKQLLFSKTCSCNLYLDDQAPIFINKFHFIVSMIHRYEGGGFQFCPKADYQDGLLDLCVIGNLPKYKILFLLPSGFSGKHIRFKGVDIYRAKKLKIVASQKMPVHCDGESCHILKEISVACISEKLHMIIS